MSEAELSVSDDYEQAMPDMDSESYETLKESIRKHGVEYPLLVDADGTVIDGHHRLRAWRELGRDGDPPTIVVNSKDDMERALRANLARRDLSNGGKRDAVKRYLERHWDGERSQREVASDLGVSVMTVSRAAESVSGVTFSTKNQPKEQAAKSEVRAYIDDNPDASNREVAAAVECDVSHATVGNWRHELEAEHDTAEQPEPEEPERAFAPNNREREAATDVFNRASEGDEAAQEEAKQIHKGKKPPSAANKDAVRRERKRREQEAAETTEETLNEKPSVEEIDVTEGQIWELGRHILYCGDSASDEFRELAESCPFAFADPPYNAGAAEWDEGFEWQHDWLNEVAEVVAVTPGIGSLFDFAEITGLPYQWSVACWIANGRARGKMGYGNWVHVAIFSEESIHRNSQDIVKVTIKESEKNESHHRGRKFPKLMTWLFERYCGEGETVVDPFLGSGTTLLAAESADRRCIGAEIEPEFCEEIIGRWESLAGESAELI